MKVKKCLLYLVYQTLYCSKWLPWSGCGVLVGSIFEMTYVWEMQVVKGDFGKWQRVARSPLHLSGSGMVKGRYVAGL